MPNLNVVAVNKRKSKSRITGTTRLGLAPKTKKAISTIVKKQINKNEESKFLFQTITGNVVSNNIYTMSPIQSLAIGTGQNNRVGNQVRLQRLTIQFLLQNSVAWSQTNLRVLVFWSPYTYSAGWSLSNVTSFGSSDIMLGTANNFASPIDFTKPITLLYDKKHTINAKDVQTFNTTTNLTFTKNQIYRKISIPLNGKKIQFVSGSSWLTEKNLYVVLIPQSADTNVIAGVSTVGALDIQSIISYKDA